MRDDSDTTTQPKDAIAGTHTRQAFLIFQLADIMERLQQHLAQARATARRAQALATSIPLEADERQLALREGWHPHGIA